MRGVKVTFVRELQLVAEGKSLRAALRRVQGLGIWMLAFIPPVFPVTQLSVAERTGEVTWFEGRKSIAVRSLETVLL